MSDRDEQLDRELDRRHREGETRAKEVLAHFALFCADKNLPVILKYVKREISLHCTELAFNIAEAQTGNRWRIFPAIFLRSRPGFSVEYSLFASTEAGEAETREFETLDAFAEAIGQKVLEASRGPAQLRNERREAARRHEVTPTIVSLPGNVQPLTALIVNRSHTGLMIALANEQPLPDSFAVLLDNRQMPCSKVWQEGKMVGVRLLPSPEGQS